MKTNTKRLVIGLFWLVTPALATAQDDKEKTAIKAVIENETTAYFGANYQSWIDSWVHTPYAFWSSADSTGFHTFSGWKAIEIGFTDYFLTSKPTDARIDRRWNDIRVYGNGAYARFVQVTTQDGVTREEDEIRILEKHSNQWKIVLVGVMQGAKYK